MVEGPCQAGTGAARGEVARVGAAMVAAAKAVAADMGAMRAVVAAAVAAAVATAVAAVTVGVRPSLGVRKQRVPTSGVSWHQAAGRRAHHLVRP